MEQDFTFSNPPLVEVVVELRWAIQPLQSMPGAAIDPHFAAFQTAFSAALTGQGFGDPQSLKPDNVPIEFCGHIVTKRYRQRPNAWPAIQIGPGVLTVNIVPPYNGWKSFRPDVLRAFEALFQSYPVAANYLKLEQLQLRYVDAFVARHGFDGRYGRFVKENFTLGVHLPEEITKSAEAPEEITVLADIRVPIRPIAGAVGSMKFAPGIINGQSAVVSEFGVSGQVPNAKDPSSLLIWLDEAHNIVRSWFLSIPREQLLKTMGERTPIQLQ